MYETHFVHIPQHAVQGRHVCEVSSDSACLQTEMHKAQRHTRHTGAHFGTNNENGAKRKCWTRAILTRINTMKGKHITCLFNDMEVPIIVSNALWHQIDNWTLAITFETHDTSKGASTQALRGLKRPAAMQRSPLHWNCGAPQCYVHEDE